MASSSETRLVESHLGTCPDCRRALNWMQATQVVISKRPAVLPPPDLRARIAHSIAQSELAARPIRTAPRPFVLRPVFLTAAAITTLAAFGVWVDNSVLISKPIAQTQPTTGMGTPGKAPNPGIAVTASTGVPIHAEKSSHIAFVPPSSALPTHHPKLHPATVTERVAKASILPEMPSAGDTSQPVFARHPATTMPQKPAQVAEQPKVGSHSFTPAPVKSFVVATRLPKTITGVKSADVAVTSSPVLASPSPQSVEAASPVVAQVAVVVPAPKPLQPAHAQVLDSVLARLASYKAASADLKVYRSATTRVQMAAYNSEPKFVQAAINYTPTALAASNTPHDH